MARIGRGKCPECGDERHLIKCDGCETIACARCQRHAWDKRARICPGCDLTLTGNGKPLWMVGLNI